MNNNKLILVNGAKVPVSRVKHWRYAPQKIVPLRSELETLRWRTLEAIRQGWNLLDASMILDQLDDSFTYGSYWVNGSGMDLAGYRDYLPGKFDTIRKSGSGPKVDIAVLYEGLTPEEFPYALRLVQGDVTCLLTMKFTGAKVSSMYMTDPDIYTYEPTFAKGGITDSNGEPRVFRHECEEADRGRSMGEKELQEFAVKCIEQLYREAGAEIVGVYKSKYKEFPNLVVKCGCDLFYHRIDVSERENEGAIADEDRDEFIAAAKMHGAWPMVLPVSFWCADTEGGDAVCGGSFFMKVLESVIVQETQQCG